MADQFWNLLQQALQTSSRSTVLKPLAWLIALMLAGSIGSFRFGSPQWFSAILGIMCISSVMLYIAAYIYFAINDRDALRSEKFSIQKLAIQRGFIGDDQSGYIKIDSQRGEQSSIETVIIKKEEEQ